MNQKMEKSIIGVLVELLTIKIYVLLE